MARKNDVFVLGFAFSENCEQVLIIKKLRPEHLLERPLSGVGGKIEATDVTAADALSRETLQESGVEVEAGNWNYIDTFLGKNKSGYRSPVHVFVAEGVDLTQAQTKTDEVVSVRNVDELLMDEKLDWRTRLYIANWSKKKYQSQQAKMSVAA